MGWTIQSESLIATKSSMSEPYYIRYTPQLGFNSHEVDLRALGESLIGFADLTKELAGILGIRGELVTTATRTQDGSVVIVTLIDLSTSGDFIFETAQHGLDFLKIYSPQAYSNAIATLNQIGQQYETVEEYFSKRPIQLAAILYVLTRLIKLSRNLKSRQDGHGEDVPQRIVDALLSFLNSKGFKSLLEPIIQDAVQKIELSENPNFSGAAKIDEGNFQEYLPEEEMILPHLEAGSHHTLEGRITSLKSTRGDSLTFKYVWKGKPYNLDLLPEYEKTTKSYTDFYKEEVVTKVMVIRDSMYKKPKLRTEKIELQSPMLPSKDDDQTESNLNLEA